LARFDREFFDAADRFTQIGRGSIGGKALGLAFARDLLASDLDPAAFPGITVEVPTLTVIGTDVFAAFVEENGLQPLSLSDEPDRKIAHDFQRGTLPTPVLGDLRALVEKVHSPLAVRSSSLLEDAMYRPFAGVYATKMIPNNQPEPDVRFRKLVEAVKFVYASTWFRHVKDYVAATGKEIRDERMAVIIQEVVGDRFGAHGERFYPHLSGVARSFNFYPTGHGRPEDGVVSLALGLGKTIVDGGICWSFAPPYPRTSPPSRSPRDLLDGTQTRFWAVNMGEPPAYDPIAETEYLIHPSIVEAEEDGALRHLVSTYDAASDRLVLGMGREGPRALTFAPLLSLEVFPLNSLVARLLAMCEAALGEKVEIEFAMTIRDGDPPQARFGFLQIRPLVVSQEFVEVTSEDLERSDALVAAGAVLGNGTLSEIRDIVYVRPAGFERRANPEIAMEIETINRGLVAERRPYLLIGFGRWGTADPWLGVPVRWGQISGARAIVEAALPDLAAEPSQGSHFFHNLTSFRVLYFSLMGAGAGGIDWDWLDHQPAIRETALLRHLRLEEPLAIRVDGRSGRGVVLRPR
jgi:hypothetical protein